MDEMERVEFALARSLRAVAELREIADPVEFDRIVLLMLQDQGLTLRDLWGDEVDQMQPDQLEVLERNLCEYKEFKQLILPTVRSGRTIIWKPESLFQMSAEISELFGSKLAGYSKFVLNLLAVETIHHFEQREICEAERWNDKGDGLNGDGRYQEALECFDQALGLSPRFCLAWVNRGIALKNLGQVRESITCYDRVIGKLEPEYRKAWHNKAVALYESGELDEARRCVERALQIAPKYSQAISLSKEMNSD